MRLHDSPKDKQARDEAVQLILRRVGLAAGLWLAGGLLAAALGVTWWIIILFGLVIAAIVLFHT